MSKFGRILLIATFSLVGFGIVIIYSASAVLADHQYGNPQFFLVRQVIFAFIGIALFFCAVSLPVKFYKQHARTMSR